MKRGRRVGTPVVFLLLSAICVISSSGPQSELGPDLQALAPSVTVGSSLFPVVRGDTGKGDLLHGASQVLAEGVLRAAQTSTLVPSTSGAIDDLVQVSALRDTRALSGTHAPRASGAIVTLSFDDGPDPLVTPAVLKVLKRHQARAVFCVVGNRAVRHPEIIDAIVAGGHVLCNHSNSHPKLTSLSAAKARAEVARTDRRFQSLGTGEVPWFRAPYGAWSVPALREAKARGMYGLGWTVDTRDWTRPGSAAIEARIVNGARDGAVVLVHDGLRGTGLVVALQRALPRVRAAGYSFDVPLPGAHVALPPSVQRAVGN
jgi:peptidoglycan-N-acetylglucosamine deacetylase